MLKIKSNFKTENTIDNMTGVHNPLLELTYVCAFLKKNPTHDASQLSFPPMSIYGSQTIYMAF